MQRPKRRLTKHEMRQDRFVERILEIWAYCQENWPKVMAGAGGLLVIVLIGIFIQKQVEERTQASVGALGRARVALMQGRGEEALREAEMIARDYSGKPAAAQALQLAGSIYFDQGKHANAQIAYQNYLDEYGSDGAGGYAAWGGIGACLEETGDRSAAAQKYRTYAQAHPASPFAPLALKEAARCYRGLDDSKSVQSILQRIVDDYPQSQTAEAAKLELEMMGAR